MVVKRPATAPPVDPSADPPVPSADPPVPSADPQKAELESMVRRVIAELLPTGTPAPAADPSNGLPQSAASIEAQAEQAVLSVLHKLQTEEELDERDARIAKVLELAEKTPGQVRKITKMMWGGEQ